MLQIVGEDTLLRQTVERINGLVPPENIWLVTTEDMALDIRFHLVESWSALDEIVEKDEAGNKIKRVVLKPGAKLSLQLHKKRSEHWIVVTGTARVTREDDKYLIHTNESTYIPINIKYRLENPGEIPLQVIEVQNGEYLEEDDIERFDDDYGRT